MQIMKQLKNEVSSIRDRIPKLSEDNAFVYWFLSAYLMDSDDSESIKTSIVGATGDVNIDAYYIDEKNKKVFLIQAKYRDDMSKSERRNDLISFLDIESSLYEKERLDNLLTNANEEIKVILPDIYKKLNRQKYDLAFLYATTGKIARDLKKEMMHRPKWAHPQLFDGKALLGLYNDYLEGAAPPIPYIELPIDDKQLIEQYNPDTDINNYIFFVKTSSIKSVFKKYEVKLFSRNIRGFLGETAINKRIQWSLRKEPEYFIYLNNGITIVCDNAKSYTVSGQTMIRIDNPQIINGQQTTRCIALEPSDSARVLVRVVAIPKESDDNFRSFSDMVTKIVASTNYQNAIKPSDLRANDKEQIRMEKDFRKYNYHYLRKRMAKTEEKKYFADNFRYRINRLDLVKAIASTIYNPYLIRKGVEHFYEDDTTYHRIFAKRPAKGYLLYHWLHKLIKKESDSERSYVVWFVMNEVFQLTKEILGKKRNRDVFIYLCERQTQAYYSEILKPLVRIINEYFSLYVKSFFGYSKKQSPEFIEVSTFFNNQAIQLKFEKYYKSHAPKSRKNAIQKNILKFKKEIEEFEYPE